IADLRGVAEGLKPVSKPLRHVELSPILRGELEALPLAIARGSGPQIDDHVPDRPLEAAHDLHLAMRRTLEVHAAQGPPQLRMRGAVLNEARRQSARRILPSAEGAGEEAALVVDRLGLDQPGATELGLKKSHGGKWHGGKTHRCRKRAQAGAALERFDACSASAKGGSACGSRRGVQPRPNLGSPCALIPAAT